MPVNLAQWRLVSDHFDRVIDLSERDRAGYLADLAVNDPDIAAQLSNLLTAPRKDAFAAFLMGDSPMPSDLAATSTLIGRRVGAYEITAEIGRGGMGSVWRARRADGRYEGTVAIKFVHAAWIGSAGEQRFRLEGGFLGRLDHPNIARLIDAGVLDGAQPYLVLEYIEGLPIDGYCERQQLGCEARVTLFLGVLAAVSHAHSHLIVHRDLKPANIFVTHDNSVKLLDFGIARLIDGDANGAAQTKSGAVALTPQYAAPEQLLGRPVTTATDVYALGLVLYLLLTSKHPVDIEGTSSVDLIRAIVDGEIPAASSVGQIPGITPRQLQGDLDNILAKALKKSPGERYGSADAFADDLRRFLTNEPVQARADTWAYRAAKFWRRHRRGVVAGTMVGLMLVAATTLAWIQKVEADRQRDAARFETRSAESGNEFLNALLLSDNGAKETALTTSQRIDLGAAMLESQYRDDPRFAGRMLVQLSRQYVAQDKTAEAVALNMRAYQLGVRAHDAELMALAQCKAAYAEANASLVDKAPQRIAEARRLLAETPATRVETLVICNQAESDLEFRQGNTARAEALLRNAKLDLENAGETFRMIYVNVLLDLSDVLNQRSKFAESLALQKTIAEAHRRFGRGGTAALLTPLSNEAVILINMGEYTAALPLVEEVRERRRALQGAAAEPLSIATIYAADLFRLGRIDEAIESARQISDRAQASGNLFWRIAALTVMCSAYLTREQTTDAAAALAEVQEAVKGIRNDDVYLRGAAASLQAQVALHQADPAAALQFAKVALVAMDIDTNPINNDARVVMDVAADASLMLTHVAAADAYAERALTMAQAAARGPDTSADVGEALLVLAKVRSAERRPNEAKTLAEHAARCFTQALGADHRLTQEARGAAQSAATL